MGDTLIPFLPDLFDLGHVHVVWSVNLGRPIQDPATVGNASGNQYGPSDVFTDASGANLYRVDGSGNVSPAGQTTPPSQQQFQQNGNQVPSPIGPSNRAFIPAGGSVGTNPGAQTGAAVATGLGGIGSVLTQNTRIAGIPLPNFAWLTLLGGGIYMVSSHRVARR